jgi:ribosome-associated protein
VSVQEYIINDSEYQIKAIRSSGPGGQHVNKVSTGISLKFDIEESSLPDDVKERLKVLADARITKDGVIVIKSTNSRSQEKNKTEAIARLQSLIQEALIEPKKRKKTKPSKMAKEKRLQSKAKKSSIKEMRKKPEIGA